MHRLVQDNFGHRTSLFLVLQRFGLQPVGDLFLAAFKSTSWMAALESFEPEVVRKNDFAQRTPCMSAPSFF
jgi:hypothetical protein